MEMVPSTSTNATQPPVNPPRTRWRVLASFICRFLYYRSSSFWSVFMILLFLREAYLLNQRVTKIVPDQLAPNFHDWNTCTETLHGPSQCFANLSRVPAPAGNSTVDVRVLGLALNISVASFHKSRTDILTLLDNRNPPRDHLNIPQKDSLGLCITLIERTLDRLQAAGAGADLDSSTACRRHQNLELLLSMAMADQESCLRELRNVWIREDGSKGQNRLKCVVKELEFPNLRMVNSALALARALEKSCLGNVSGQEREISKVPSNHHVGGSLDSSRHLPMLYRSPWRSAWSVNKTAGAVEEKKTVQRRSSSSSSDDYWEF